MRENQDGFTLIEALAAFVIISILLLVLSQGILAASSWFAEGDRIKNEGEVVSNAVDGTDSTNVTKEEQKNANLSVGDMKLGEDNTKTRTYTYKDSDTMMKDMDTQVPDVIGNSTYYAKTVEDASNTAKDIENLWKSIPSMSAEERQSLGLSGGNANGNTQLLNAWLKKGNSFPSINRTFIDKHGLEAGGQNIQNLYVRCHFYNLGNNTKSPSVLIYACTSPNMSGTPWSALMVYVDGYWYLAPRAKMPSMRYVPLTVTVSGLPPVVKRVETDTKGWLHVDTEPDSDVTHRCTEAGQYMNYVRDSKNGWTKLTPVSD